MSVVASKSNPVDIRRNVSAEPIQFPTSLWTWNPSLPSCEERYIIYAAGEYREKTDDEKTVDHLIEDLSARVHQCLADFLDYSYSYHPETVWQSLMSEYAICKLAVANSTGLEQTAALAGEAHLAPDMAYRDAGLKAYAEKHNALMAATSWAGLMAITWNWPAALDAVKPISKASVAEAVRLRLDF